VLVSLKMAWPLPYGAERAGMERPSPAFGRDVRHDCGHEEVWARKSLDAYGVLGSIFLIRHPQWLVHISSDEHLLPWARRWPKNSDALDTRVRSRHYEQTVEPFLKTGRLSANRAHASQRGDRMINPILPRHTQVFLRWLTICLQRLLFQQIHHHGLESRVMALRGIELF
jgi:hypothetical protein